MDPLFGQTYVDVPATGAAVKRMQRPGVFVATRMAPRMLVNKPSGLYPMILSADLLRDEMEARGPHSPAQKAGWRRIMKNFETDARSLGYDNNDAETAASDVETNPEILIPRVLSRKALIHMERRASSAYFAAGVWTRNITGAGADANLETNAVSRLYLDNANADPIEAFTDEIRRLSLAAGCDAMDIGLTIGALLWHKVRNHAKVKSQIVGVAGGALGQAIVAMARQAEADEFAKLLGISSVLVARAVYNANAMTSVPATDATQANSYIIPASDALLYVNPAAGEENGGPMLTVDNDQPPAFARAVWTGVASSEGIQIRRFRDEKAGPGGSWSSVIDVYNGFVVVSPEAAVRFTGMTTP